MKNARTEKGCCYQCTKRVPACHAECLDYKEECRAREERNAAIRLGKERDWVHTERVRRLCR